MTAYMIDSSITPLHFMVSDELIVTDRARTHLAADGWTSPEALVALLLDLATDIQGLPAIQHRMYVEQFCANRRTKETAMIDTNTGLPELPEGQFWRVKRSEHGFGFSFDFHHAPYELHLCQATKQMRTVPGKWWKLQAERKYEFVSDVVVAASEIYRRRKIEDAPESVDRDSPNAVSRWVTGDDKLTPEAIKETASRILDQQAERARVKSLLGDYPPKSL